MTKKLNKVVIADSHSLFRDGLISLLEADGYQVVGQTGDFDSTLSLVRDLQPDILLLDIALPGEGGNAALKIVKNEYSHIHVVIMSSQDRQDELFEAIRLGADGFLYKDLSAEEFLELLGGLERGEAAITRKTATRIMKGFQQESDEEKNEGGECLSKRELELLHLVFEGHSNKMIAEELFISENTVKYHIKNILQKLGVNNRTEAVSQALRAGILHQDD